MADIDVNALQETYKAIYQIVEANDDLLIKFFNDLSGQQINLPVHLYDAEAVKRQIEVMVRSKQEMNVNDIAEYYGYSRRWVRQAIKDATVDKEDNID